MIAALRGGVGIVYCFDSNSMLKRGKAEGYLQLPQRFPDFIRSMGVLTTKSGTEWYRAIAQTDDLEQRRLSKLIDPTKIMSVKDQEFKAKVLASFAMRERTKVVIYDDKPHKIGAALLALALDDSFPPFGQVGIIAARSFNSDHKDIHNLESLVSTPLYSSIISVYRDEHNLIFKTAAELGGDRIHVTSSSFRPEESINWLTSTAYPI